MQRREFLFSSVAVAVTAALAHRAVADAPAGESARALLDAIFDRMLVASPEGATTLGLDTGKHAALRAMLDDQSPAGRMSTLGPVADAWPALQSVDRARLAARDRTYIAAVTWLSEISREVAAQSVGRVDSYGYPVPYAVSQLTGAYQSTPDFLVNQHPIESASDADAFLARLAQFGREVDFDTAATREDARRGFIPPDFIVDKTLAQLRLLRAQPGAQSPMTQSLISRTTAKGIAGDWGARASRIIDGPLAKALDSQIAAVTDQRQRATHDPGMRSRPGGEVYYPLCLRYQTSTRLTPGEAHAIGLAQVAELTAEADDLLKAQGYTEGTVGARLAALTRDPKWLYPNNDAGRAELLADEIGMYRDFPLGRIGMLQSYIYRAVRIVVDTGMHWNGWSRERAVDYMELTVGLARAAVESEVNRYCVWPGQACGYKIGHTEFVRLRAAAQAKLGANFDLRGFHDAVLQGGPVPLEVLEQVVNNWSVAQSASHSR